MSVLGRLLGTASHKPECICKKCKSRKCHGFRVNEQGVHERCSGEADTLFASPPDDNVGRVVTLVHGTFAQHTDWIQKGELYDVLKALPKTDKQLDPHEDSDTVLTSFCWSGLNTHTARLQAGKDLAFHLRKLIEKFPKARQFVIAHSHGGNVVLYATKDESCRDGRNHRKAAVLGDQVAGVITLATPFIALRQRSLPGIVRTSVWFTVIFAVAVMIYSLFNYHNADFPKRYTLTTASLDSLRKAGVPETAVAQLADKTFHSQQHGVSSLKQETRQAFRDELGPVVRMRTKKPGENEINQEIEKEVSAEVGKLGRFEAFVKGDSGVPFSNVLVLAGLFLVWLIATGFSAYCYRGRNFGWMKLFQLSLPGKGFAEAREDLLARELTRLELEKTLSNKLLVIRPLGDEASMGLVVAQCFAWVQNRVLNHLTSLQGAFFFWRKWIPRGQESKNESEPKDRSWLAFFFSWAFKLGVIIAVFAWLAWRPSVERKMLLDAFDGIISWVFPNVVYESVAGVLHFVLTICSFIVVMTVLAVYLIFSIASLLLLLGLSLVAAAFGVDAMFWSLFASTTAETSPVGDVPAEIFLAGELTSSDLAHCGIYKNKVANQQIARWIMSRSGDPARST